MKVMDMLGNQLRAGDVLYFKPVQGLVVVSEIEEPGKIQKTPGRLHIEMIIPFEPDKSSRDVAFADLMKVYTPDESGNQRVQEILDRVAGLRDKRPS